MPVDVGPYHEEPDVTVTPGSSAGRYCHPGRTTLAPITGAGGVGPIRSSSATSLTERPLVNSDPGAPSPRKRSSACRGIPPVSIRASASARSEASSSRRAKNPIPTRLMLHRRGDHGRKHCRSGAALFVTLKRISDQPDHREPQPDEQRATLGVAALVLIDRLGPDPQADAEGDRAEREALHVPCPQAGVVEASCQHGLRCAVVAVVIPRAS